MIKHHPTAKTYAPAAAEATRRTVRYRFNGVGALATTSLPNGLTNSYVYNGRNQLLQLSTSKISNQQTAILNQFTYTLAATGHRTNVSESSTRSGGVSPPSTTRSVSYVYDILHRLTGETVADSHGPSGTVGYTLDAVSNRTTRSSTLPGVTAQTQSVDSNDRLTTDTTDANGNTLASLLAGNTVTDIYDFENRLIRRTDSSGKTIDLSYDTDGNRTAKTKTHVGQLSETTRYLVDTQNATGYAQVVEEHTATGNTPALLATVYAYGADLIGQDRRATSSSPWTLSYYLYDGGGHVRALSNAAATSTDEYAYDAYGILLSSIGTTQNNYLY